MAGFNLTINSQFRPYSFDEYLKPYLIYGQEYKDVESKLADVSTKAGMLESMANEANDPIAYAQYKRYADDLNKQATSLATEGLNINSRKGLLDMYSRYSKEIAPIERAYAKREELAKAQRARMEADPTYRYKINFNEVNENTSLDRFLENSNYGDTTGYSGALLTQQVGQVAGALSKELRDPSKKGSELRKQLQSVLPYQYRLLEQHGFDSNEVLSAIMENENANPILTNLVDTALTSSGVRDWADASTLQDFEAYAKQGLWNAVGQSNYRYLTDNYGMQNATLMNKAGLDAAKKYSGLPVLHPSNIYSSRELNKADKAYKEYSKYFTKNEKGEYILTKEGEKEFAERPITNYASYMPQETKFRSFMKDLIGKTGMSPGQAWEIFEKSGGVNPYDAYKSTTYDMPFGSDAQKKSAKDIIMSHLYGDNIKEVDFDADTKSFVPSGKSHSLKDLRKATITGISTSSHGNIFTAIFEDGSRGTFRLPSINKVQEDNLNALYGETKALELQYMKETNPYLREDLKAAYMQRMAEIAQRQAQLFGTSEIESQKFKTEDM